MLLRKTQWPLEIAMGLIEGDITVKNNIYYYSGNILKFRFKEILRRCITKDDTIIYESNCNNSESDDDDFLDKINTDIFKYNISNTGIYGYIYELSSPKTNKIYIGSTTNLENRINGHLKSTYSYDKYKMGYCGSYEIFKTGEIIVKIIKKGDYDNYRELFTDEYNEIYKKNDMCSNVKYPVNNAFINNECRLNSQQRKIDKINCLFQYGEKYLINRMSDADLIKLKLSLLDNIQKDIYDNFEYNKINYKITYLNNYV